MRVCALCLNKRLFFSFVASVIVIKSSVNQVGRSFKIVSTVSFKNIQPNRTLLTNVHNVIIYNYIVPGCQLTVGLARVKVHLSTLLISGISLLCFTPIG